MSIAPVRVNYLNNRELLAEIHKSKTSYCYFVDKVYSNYDAIVSSLDDINSELIEETKIKRANQLMQKQKIDQKALGLRLNQIKIEQINPEDIPIEDLVWRIMTFDHIPLDPERLKKPKNEAEKHIKTNFPPFRHFIKRDSEFVEVGRSHWRDGLHNGEFFQDHGKITNRLAMMFMKLVERYSQRSNWRGYCVSEDTEALTQRGWLGIDEITENDTILSYSEGILKWSKIKSFYRGEFDGLMHKLTVTGMDTLITPNHKLVTERGLIPVEYLLETDKLILMGDPVAGVEDKIHSDSMVELLGWIVTEGCYDVCKKKGIRRISIYQNEGHNAERIRNCLRNLNYVFSERLSKNNLCFSISRADSRKILEILPVKNLSMDFILSLTNDQRELLINTMIDGDGWRTGDLRRYCQKNKDHVDLFQILCALSGHRTNTHLRKHIAFGKETESYGINLFTKRGNKASVESVNFHGGKNNGHDVIGKGKIFHPNQPTTPYKGRVWCPETEYGCFMARRNGTVYLTGNTYVSEMRGQALMQLSLVGLQFDESRSDNPFAYFTVVASNSFTRILNLEKRNQNIRDDILIMNGVAPSITRQIDDEMAQKAAIELADNLEKGIESLPSTAMASKRGAFGRPLSKTKSSK